MALKLGNPAWRIWVAELDGSVVGFTLEQIMGDALVQKRGLFVDPDMQGRGIGKLLFEESLKDIPRGATVRLSVIENNHRAKELYKKYGFVTVGYDSKSFYGSRLEVMELQLD
jgi:ribosomal protein S18 acetylase RimI-like enzyme